MDAAPTSTSTTTITSGLAARLRSEAAEVHAAAERSVFVRDLLAGRRPVADYARLARQHVAIYSTLERLEAANIEPTLAPFLTPALHRTGALHADLTALAGECWADEIVVLDATAAYCRRIEDAVAEFAGLLLAHHYVRYLGDLSGGQIIGRALQRTYGFAGTTATAFYRFEAIGSPKAFKDRYREALDALPWSADRQQRLIDEVCAAYQHHTAIFAALAPLPTPGNR